MAIVSDGQADDLKRRLTEKADLLVAARLMLLHGVRPEDIGVKLCRHYYVDIDLLNEVVDALSRRSPNTPRATLPEALSKVA